MKPETMLGGQRLPRLVAALAVSLCALGGVAQAEARTNDGRAGIPRQPICAHAPINVTQPGISSVNPPYAPGGFATYVDSGLATTPGTWSYDPTCAPEHRHRYLQWGRDGSIPVT